MKKVNLVLWKQIDDILWNDWDPIGVNDCEAARNEYESYIAGIYKLLISQSDIYKMANHLTQLTSVSMGLEKNIKHSELIAMKLIKL